jgi:hypothetical protein
MSGKEGLERNGSKRAQESREQVERLKTRGEVYENAKRCFLLIYIPVPQRAAIGLLKTSQLKILRY